MLSRVQTVPAETDHASRLLGTQAIINQEQFNALLGLLLRKRAISKADVADLFMRLADRLEAHFGGHDEYRTCPIELHHHAARLKARAAQISEGLK